MLLIALASFGAIVLAWVFAPEAKATGAIEPSLTVPASVSPARA